MDLQGRLIQSINVILKKLRGRKESINEWRNDRNSLQNLKMIGKNERNKKRMNEEKIELRS